ncbi:unnamed protein product [Nezara viridula]|uniref:protein-tyrosine-phosphatase n=1 Tax=Nezara viridula TaxID=85310 RepID=A0A9P0H4S3_NEZVI|nr:unnamed protein product [Nezara viridula]
MKTVARRITQTTNRNFKQDPDIVHVAEFLMNRFCLVTFKKNIMRQDTPQAHLFSIDDSLLYQGFFVDFGPLNLGLIYRYCLMVASKLNSKELSQKMIIHYTWMDPRKRANAGLLAATFAVLYLGLTPKKAWDILRIQKGNYEMSLSKIGYLPFRDAQPFTNKETIENTISIYDCLKAMDCAVVNNFVDFSDFLLGHYEAFQINGYSLLNWIVPSKLLALCNPSKESLSPLNINRLIRYFLHYNVGVVVRLNEATYSALRFTDVGIKHVDLYFDDGTVPPYEILCDFLNLVENSKQAVAVHCRAGLGRTGSLIAAYLMKHYRLTTKEAVAWLRICRPGSVISHQQAWLDAMQSQLWESGNIYRMNHSGLQERLTKHKLGIYSKNQIKVKKSSYLIKRKDSRRNS